MDLARRAVAAAEQAQVAGVGDRGEGGASSGSRSGGDGLRRPLVHARSLSLRWPAAEVDLARAGDGSGTANAAGDTQRPTRK